MSAGSITLVEVGPRDGLQNEAARIPTARKIEFIRRAADAGLTRIEAASFVSPKAVPQMADAEAVLDGLPEDLGATTIGLVLNRQGYERALAAGCDEIGFVVVASETFSRRNQGQSVAEAIAVWHDIARDAAARGVPANVMVSAACGCPFEGEIDPERVISIAAELVKSPAREIGIADTIGAGVPSQIKRLIEGVKAVSGARPVRVHLHNTRNTAIANICAAIESGATLIDASIGGIGGCPFAPRATGNVATEDVVYLLERMGIKTGVSLEQLIATAMWIEGLIGRAVPGMVTKAGGFPRSRVA